MTTRSILQTFEQYQRARLAFAQSVAELALRPPNTDILNNAGILDLLKPLLTDPCQQIQQCSAITLGRLVHNNSSMAELLINQNFLPILLGTIQTGNKYHKRSILFVLRSICKHDPNCAMFVINCGGLQALTGCLEDFEAGVKESAAWGIGYIARHSKQLAQTCVDAGVVPLLLLCLQEPELTLKQIATSAISDIAKHSVELAQNVVDAGVVPYLVKNLSNTDEKLKKQILCALSIDLTDPGFFLPSNMIGTDVFSSMLKSGVIISKENCPSAINTIFCWIVMGVCAKHSVDLAEVVVEAEIFPSVLLHLGHPNPSVRQSAASLIRDIVKHSLELTQLVVNTGGIGALMEVLYQDKSDDENGAKLPAITALGFISGHSDQFAMSVLGCRAIVSLAQILQDSKNDAILSVTAWTIGQIGKHSPEHSQAVAAANIFPRLLNLYLSDNSSDDLKYKCKNCLKLCLQKCLLLSALEPLLYDAPPNILKYVLGQYSKTNEKT